ncbi:MAG TPA: PSD1 and planctomycete cytochrome C domain-containing protein [Gemmataceae bacterium]|nr:PSD1 and planctomycete cytochrome C domain-containing protein [Gemmataceae bacterium]
MCRILSSVFCGLFVFAVFVQAAEPGKPVDYTRDIKPILSDRCYACHGPDEKQRQKNLRLDVRENAIKSAITPGDADSSELVDRLQAEEKDYYMPPPSSKKPRLTKEQIELIKRWINAGAKFDEHWAYVKPLRPQVPTALNPNWVRNPIDNFVAIEHGRHGFRSSPEADRVTLIRRLSFDLIGLPPSPEDVDSFLNDKSPEAYSKLVAKLLDSKHFGERMALYWLDLVRYADTGGYHSDNGRDVTLYRDYVIDAFNKNKPFDQFTIEQLAGDLLPDATLEQRIASGYNRLLMTTEEGGAQPKEYAAKYAADRVRNVSAVWLASTMGCCECHDHKFDPFRTKEFYSLAAFFADIQEKPVGRQDQTQLPTPQQAVELKQLDAKIAELKKKLHEPNKELDAAQVKWEEEVKAKKPGKEFPKPVLAILNIDPAKRNDKQKQAVFEYFRSVTPQLKDIQTPLAETQKRRDDLNAVIPTTLLSMSGPPRAMRVLPRGNWLDDSGEIVQPEVPAALGKLGLDRRANRLDLAKWLVAPDNPVVARVFVNRLWKLVFGQGLVKSLDDFGSQGSPPTHSQLLDWLAVEFQQSGWNVQHMLTLMVTSATYRQSSAGSNELHERDPGNLWLARQNRFRLDAECVRDNALAVAGMLSEHVGGPSVRPAQPAGYWSFLNFPVREWEKDHDEKEYRRGLYIYWCRSFLHPYLLAFDAPSREECTVERPRSSTPVQALVLLNDPNFVEAARVFAEKIIHVGGKSTEQRFAFAYRRALSRPPKPEEIKVLLELLEKHRAEFARDKGAAKKLLLVGDWPQPKDIDPVELAAWTSVARVILNLNETMTRN